MHVLAGLIAAWSVAAAPPSVDFVVEPKTGSAFAKKVGDMSLLGVGLRTKSFLKFKVYVLGLYVADSALSGPLAVHKGKVGTSAFYRDVAVGDFEKQFVLRLARDLSAEQIQGTFRSHMPDADPKQVQLFVSYFGAQKSGQELLLHWIPGRGLETTVNGKVEVPFVDKDFADAVFAMWLRDRPELDPIRKQLVSRAHELLK
jgi:hypothetical protein